jgi:hypothetical protein
MSENGKYVIGQQRTGFRADCTVVFLVLTIGSSKEAPRVHRCSQRQDPTKPAVNAEPSRWNEDAAKDGKNDFDDRSGSSCPIGPTAGFGANLP